MAKLRKPKFEMPASFAPLVYFYLRVSTPDQRGSFDRVLQQGKECIARLKEEGYRMGKILTEIESAVEVRWDERPVFVELMKLLNPGDHLIIEAKDRLDRDDLGMLNCLHWLERRGVILHCLNSGGGAIDLRDEREQILNHFDALASWAWVRQHRKRIKEMAAYHKRMGYSYGPLSFGKKRILAPDGAGNGRTRRKIDVWDEKQCQVLREVVYLRDALKLPWKEVASRLEAMGILPPAGGKWLYRVARNPYARSCGDGTRFIQNATTRIETIPLVLFYKRARKCLEDPTFPRGPTRGAVLEAKAASASSAELEELPTDPFIAALEQP